MSNVNLRRGNAEQLSLLSPSVNLRVLVKQSMVRPIVGEHWRVFDTTVDTPEESGMGSRAAFPRYRGGGEKKRERRGSEQKMFAERITRTMLLLPARPPGNRWEIYENI